MQAREQLPSWVRAPRCAPALRGDLTFAPRGELIRLYEPTGMQFVQLYALECHLAQHMDGKRDLDELTTIAQHFDHAIMREAVERLVVQLHAVGLLERAGTPPPPPASSAPRTHGELAWQFDDDDAPFDRPPLLVTAPTPSRSGPVPLLRVVHAPQDFDDETVTEAAGHDVDPDPGVPARAPADDAAQPAEAEPVADASAAAVAEQEQAELWNQRKRAWHQRTWLRALAVLIALAGIAAVIPYPLRITAECTLIPRDRAKVRSELAGVITEILVDEGQRVKRGDVIAKLDDRALAAERLQVLAEIEKIKAEIAILRQGRRPEEIQQQKAVLAARQNEVVFAAKQARRRTQMAREGVGSRQAAEDATRELGSRRRAVAEAQAALRLLQAGSRPEEIAAQEAVLKRAGAELAYIDERLAMTIVRAPIDGEILTPRFRECVNEGVEAGGLVCEIADTRTMRAEIFVPERDVDAIRLGMPATVKVESYPTRPFAGKVDFIAPTVDGEGRRVRVVVELDNARGLLKANMTGYGEVEAGDRSLLHLATRRIVRWIRVRFLL